MKCIRPFGFYVFRKPLLPVDGLFNFLDQSSHREPIAPLLRTIFSKPELQEAIYYASPYLYEQLQQWLQNPAFPRKEAFQATLLKYLIRASTRSTPYGMFAGCLSPGQFGASTKITFNEQRPFTKYNRLHIKWVALIQEQFSHHPKLYSKLSFFPNDSLYQYGSKYRYIYSYLDNNARQYSLCSIDASPYLRTLLEVASSGATTEKLVTTLTEQEISPSQASEFVAELIQEQVIVCELQPGVTGEEALNALIAKLKHWESKIPEEIAALQKMQELLHAPRTSEQHATFTEFLSLEAEKNHSVVHSDLYFNTQHNTVSQPAIGKLTKTLDKLLVLDQGNYNRNIERFKEKFYHRYEEQEVPFLEALDSEWGIGYEFDQKSSASDLSLWNNIELASNEDASMVQWNYWKDFVTRKYSKALSEGQPEIVLTDHDLGLLQEHHSHRTTLPTTLTAFGSLLAESEEAVSQGNFQFVFHQFAGPSGANLLGRFCYGSPALRQQVEALVQEEERAHPEVIFAEVVHLSDQQEGMVTARPTLRRYEIPFLTGSSAKREDQIALSDLMISVKQGREIVLRSRQHNRRVIPRLSVAHNFHRGQPIYRFLGDLQYAEQPLNVRWHWSILEKQRFLPRVSYQNIILSRATWTLITEQFPTLKAKAVSDEHFRKALQDLPHFPRYVQLVENDNELLIDIENPYTLSLLKTAFRKKEIITLKEYLWSPDQCFIKDQQGCYPHEIIIPFIGQSKPYRATSPDQRAATVRRTFTVGSEWWYAKIYTGEKTADKLLRSSVKPLVDTLLAQGLIDRWFFIRYADPDPHLRLRFHRPPTLSTTDFYQAFLPMLHQWCNTLLQSGQVRKVQQDTYQREIERYGANTMEVSEDLFFHDSQSVLDFLVSPEGLDEQARWQYAFAGIDHLLDDFSYTLSQKANLLERLKEAYFDEFKVDKVLKHQMDVNYRNYARDTVECLEQENQWAPELRQLLKQRSVNSRNTVAEIINRVNRPTLDERLFSYIHMFFNRLFMANHRQLELIGYYYLWKYYRSAMKKHKIPG
uniref:Lantibiotic dehydratase n=1 Tax=Roseihalotalea indica TaxID=2867963 RepID=A0AA49JBU9_9BACT|nr:lantibiotic dehydratase [Tunicatimonas sp. TK19036]